MRILECGEEMFRQRELDSEVLFLRELLENPFIRTHVTGQGSETVRDTNSVSSLGKRVEKLLEVSYFCHYYWPVPDKMTICKPKEHWLVAFYMCLKRKKQFGFGLRVIDISHD